MLTGSRYAEPAPLPPLPGVPAEVPALYRRCLAKQPQERPTAAEVARVLAEASGWYLISDAGSGDLVIGGAFPRVAAGTAGDADADTRVLPPPPPAARPERPRRRLRPPPRRRAGTGPRNRWRHR